MSDTNNPYAAPTAELGADTAEVVGGSIEATLAGLGQLEVGTTMSAAWANLKGSKRVLLGGFLLIYLLLLPILLGGQYLLNAQLAQNQGNIGSAIGTQLLVQLAVMALTYPFTAAVFIVAARHMCRRPISIGMLFSQYGKFGALLITGILQIILIVIGYALLIVPGIYLSVAYTLALPLVADRNMGPWEALETSRKLVTKHWLTVFGILAVASLLMLLSAVFFLVPLIWTLPWLVLCVGVIYRNLAGLQTR